MVTSKQRQRQLARAKWERQQSRRTAEASRRRKIGVVVGVIVGLLAVAALIWLVLYISEQDDARTPEPTAPTDALPTTPVETPTQAPSPTPTEGTTATAPTGTR